MVPARAVVISGTDVAGTSKTWHLQGGIMACGASGVVASLSLSVFFSGVFSVFSSWCHHMISLWCGWISSDFPNFQK